MSYFRRKSSIVEKNGIKQNLKKTTHYEKYYFEEFKKTPSRNDGNFLSYVDVEKNHVSKWNEHILFSFFLRTHKTCLLYIQFLKNLYLSKKFGISSIFLAAGRMYVTS